MHADHSGRMVLWKYSFNKHFSSAYCMPSASTAYNPGQEGLRGGPALWKALQYLKPKIKRHLFFLFSDLQERFLKTIQLKEQEGSTSPSAPQTGTSHSPSRSVLVLRSSQDGTALGKGHCWECWPGHGVIRIIVLIAQPKDSQPRHSDIRVRSFFLGCGGHSIPGLPPLDARSTLPSWDNQNSFHSFLNIPWGQNFLQLRTTSLDRWYVALYLYACSGKTLTNIKDGPVRHIAWFLIQTIEF